MMNYEKVCDVEEILAFPHVVCIWILYARSIGIRLKIEDTHFQQDTLSNSYIWKSVWYTKEDR